MEKKEGKDKEQFFVGIHETRDLRRNILESSREMVHTLQSYEKVQEIREEKLRRIKQFKTVIEELKLLISKLNEAMPKVQVRQPEPTRISSSKKRYREKRVTPKRKEKEELDLKRLEEELSSIEGRLSQIK